MDASDVKTAQLPLDFSLNVKSEAIAALNIHVKSNGDNAPTANMLISPDKSSQSAFKVVTPKQNTDGMCYFPFGDDAITIFRYCERFPCILFLTLEPSTVIIAIDFMCSQQCHFYHS